MLKNDYYVYAYLDPLNDFHANEFGFKFAPFYIGRGSGARHLAHLSEYKKYHGSEMKILKEKRINVHKLNKIHKIISSGQSPIIVKIYENLTLQESKDLESQLITKFGKVWDSTGILVNITDGNEGSPKKIMSGPLNPFYGRTHAQHVKDMLSRLHKNKTISTEQREQISVALKGKKKTHQTRENMRAERRKRFIENPDSPMFHNLGKFKSKVWTIERPDGTEITILSLRNFCIENSLNAKTLIGAFKNGKVVKSGPSAGWKIISCSDS